MSPWAGARGSTPPWALWPRHLLTCWNESSKSVCRETLIFTWLGNAFDYEQGRDRRFCAGGHSSSPHLCLPVGSAPRCQALRLLYSRGRGSGTGGTSSESSDHTLLETRPACSCKSSRALGPASCLPQRERHGPAAPSPARWEEDRWAAHLQSQTWTLNLPLRVLATKLICFLHPMS